MYILKIICIWNYTNIFETLFRFKNTIHIYFLKETRFSWPASAFLKNPSVSGWIVFNMFLF